MAEANRPYRKPEEAADAESGLDLSKWSARKRNRLALILLKRLEDDGYDLEPDYTPEEKAAVDAWHDASVRTRDYRERIVYQERIVSSVRPLDRPTVDAGRAEG